MKYSYNIWREPGYSREYEHINIEVYLTEALESTSARPIVSFRWQGDANNDHWYGFHAKSETDGAYRAFEQFKAASAVLNQLSKANINYENPRAVIDALGFPRVVCDDRESKWLAIDQVKPDSWQRWTARDSNGYCIVASIAPDEDHAVRNLIKAFAEHIDGGYGSYADKLEAWIKDGKRIEADTRRAPDIRSLDEILKPMKSPAVAQPEAVAA